MASVHPLGGVELRALRRLQRETSELEIGPCRRRPVSPACKRPRRARSKLQVPDPSNQLLIVCTTDDVGRLLTVGSFMSFAIASSYCAIVATRSFPFMCTIL